MRRLRPRRHRRGRTGTRTSGAIADRKHGGIARRLQCLLDDELVDAVGLQSVELPQYLRGFDARCPDDQFRGNEGAVGEREALRRHLRHPGARTDLDAHLIEQAVGCLGYAFRQPIQDTRRGLDQDDADIALRVDAIQPVRDHFANRAMHLGGQFGAGCAGTNDRHVELAGAHWAFLRLRAQAGIEQAPIEALRLRRCLQPHRIFGNTWGVEVVRDAADSDHQRVVADRARWRDLAPFVVDGGGEMHFLSVAIKADHLAEAIAEPVPMCLRQVVHFIRSGIDGPRSNRVQQRLPNVCPGTFHQRDGRPSASTQAIAETSDEFQPSCAATHHHDPVERLLAKTLVVARRRHLPTRASASHTQTRLEMENVAHVVHAEYTGR